MADAIPVSDPGLLAAQAKSGQAGVDAYNAAISSLQAQKQQAVQGALQEAAMRGSPQGAAESQSGIISTPYDQRIASLTQGLGAFQADQSARNTRMNDYNQAVLGARSYIPQQTEQIVAPLRAQADFQVRNTEMEGQQRVAGIEADTRLTLAKMQAAFQAAQIAAAKAAADKKAKEAKLPKLTVGELTSLMSARGAADVQSRGNQIREILSANEAETLQRANTAMAATQPQADAARSQNEWDLQAARYTGRAMAESRPATGSLAATRSAAMNADRVPRGATQIRQAAGPLAPPPEAGGDDIVGYDRYSGRPIYAGQAGSAPGSAATVLGGPPSTAPINQGNVAAAMWNAINNNAQRMQGLSAGRQQVGDLSAGVTERNRQNNPAILRMKAGLGSLDTSNQEFAAFDPDTGRRVFARPSQIEGLDENTREMLMGATQIQGINSLEDFENIVMGAPSDPRTRSGQRTNNLGIGNSYSSDVMRNALARAGGEIQAQGEYDIGLPDIANAMPAKMPSIYNMLAGQSDQPTSEEAYKAMAADVAARAKAEASSVKEGSKAEEAEADQGLVATYGRVPPTELGTSVQVLTTLVDNKASIDQGKEILKQIIADWDTTRGGLNASQATTQLLKKGVEPAIIPYVLFASGL